MRYVRTDIRQPLEFLSAGQFRSSGPWTHTRREIDSYEIVIGSQGVLYMEQEGERYEVGPGDVLLLLPGVVHFGYRPSEGGLVFHWLHYLCRGNVQICGEEEWEQEHRLLRSNEYLSALNDTLLIPLFFRPAGMERIDVLFHQLQHLANSPIRHRHALHYMATSLAIELAEQAEPRDDSVPPYAPDKLVSSVVEWIRVHAADSLTASGIANQFGYNRDYLSRLFKRTMGMNLQEYIRMQKMAKAKSLLAGSNRTVKQIAHDVGFPDEKYFIRLFRKYEHLTPTGYRNAYYRKHLNIR